MSYGSGPGVDSEELIKELLQKSGWGVKELRKAADGGRAPMLESKTQDDLRLPDFQVHHAEHDPRYVEVKFKTSPREFGVEDSVRHCIDLDKWRDYQQFDRMSKNPVYVFVHEGDAGVVLRQTVTKLSPVQVLKDEDKLTAFGGVPVVFFERSQFEFVTKDLSQYRSEFGQSGLIKNDVDLSPFGLDGGGGQSTLGGF